jgi:predicted metal-dependent hydrolase
MVNAIRVKRASTTWGSLLNSGEIRNFWTPR